MNFTTNNKPTILTDSINAKELSENNCFYTRIKHINISFHFLKDKVEKDTINIIYILNLLQLVDPLTKGVLKLKYNWF